MKLESISSKTVLIGLVTVALCFTIGGMGSAMVSKTGTDEYCYQCHTTDFNRDNPDDPKYGETNQTCVECHSCDATEPTYDKSTYKLTGGGQTVVVPVVNYTGASAPTEYLAGGNFWWVAYVGDPAAPRVDDAMGHNVLDIAGQDPNYPEAPGNVNHCGNSCHYSLATTAYNSPGCHGCHMAPTHHADDTGPVIDNNPAGEGWYRFLSGHMSGSGFGVSGIEDSDWQATSDASDHNEYAGFSNWTDKNAYADKLYAAGFYNMGHTMTAFCCGCHGNYHVQNEDAHGHGRWTRHPSDWEIPNSGEYAYAFGANGTSGIGTYDPDVPVARPAGPYFAWTGPESTVEFVRGAGYWGPIGDMVMCLSCHRAHGSPYPKMLRWDLSGCFKCHTKK